MADKIKTFRFEIQNCIEVYSRGKDKEDARMRLINNLNQYAEQMVDGNCYVSDGEEENDRR